jgi:hypothetical protein
MRGYKVNLIYFKASGKYYTSGSYRTRLSDLCDIWHEVRDMPQHPGLCCRWTEGPISMSVLKHPFAHPHLIMPDVKESM